VSGNIGVAPFPHPICEFRSYVLYRAADEVFDGTLFEDLSLFRAKL
jgi:hypothetical protein